MNIFNHLNPKLKPRTRVKAIFKPKKPGLATAPAAPAPRDPRHAFRRGSERKKTRPVARAGVLRDAGSVGVGLAAARPDQGRGLAILIVEEAGVDRSGEARIVKLDREVIAALVRALGPGCPDLRPADEDAVAGRVVVGPAGFGDDAHVSRLDAEGDDFALKFFAVFLEGADIGHGSLLSFCFRARDHRGLDGDRQPDAIDVAPAGPQRSGGWRTGGFVVSRGMTRGAALQRRKARVRGRNPPGRHCGIGDRGEAGFGHRSSHKRTCGSRAGT